VCVVIILKTSDWHVSHFIDFMLDHTSIMAITDPKLPVELYEPILEHLVDDKEALSHCSLVCRTWQNLAQRFLFRRMTIHCDDYYLNMLQELDDISPQLMGHIHTLEFHYTPVHSLRHDIHPNTDLDCLTAFQEHGFIEGFVNLRTLDLHIHSIFANDDALPLYHLFPKSLRINCLRLEVISVPSLPYLQSTFPHMRSLWLNKVNFVDMNQATSVQGIPRSRSALTLDTVCVEVGGSGERRDWMGKLPCSWRDHPVTAPRHFSFRWPSGGRARTVTAQDIEWLTGNAPTGMKSLGLYGEWETLSDPFLREFKFQYLYEQLFVITYATHNYFADYIKETDRYWISTLMQLEAVTLRYGSDPALHESQRGSRDGLELTPILTKISGEKIRSITIIVDMIILGRALSAPLTPNEMSDSETTLRNVDICLSDEVKFPVLEVLIVLIENSTIGSFEHREMTSKIIQCLPQLVSRGQLKIKR
jgi:hypothetical protein